MTLHNLSFRRPMHATDPIDESSRRFAKFLDDVGAKKILEMKDLIVAMISVKFSSKSGLSSRFFGRLKILQGLEGRLETSEVPIWRSCEFLSVTMKFVSKNHHRCPKNQISTTFGGGVQKSTSIFFLIFGPKPTCTVFVR